jgi:hypothetical protein
MTRTPATTARSRIARAAVAAVAAVTTLAGLLASGAGAGPATSVQLAGVATGITVGQKDFLNVEARDGGGSHDTTYAGTVTFTASCGNCFTVTPNDGPATPTSYTFKPSDGGVTTFTLIWSQPGTHSLTVTGTLAGGGTDDDTVSGIAVSPLDATGVRLAGVDTTMTVGSTDSFNVETRNAQNDTATGYAGTVTFTASCGDCFTVTPNNGGSAATSYTFQPADGGIRTFSLTWAQSGTQSFTVTATLPGGGTATDTVTGIAVTSSTTTSSTSTTLPTTTTTSSTSTTLPTTTSTTSTSTTLPTTTSTTSTSTTIPSQPDPGPAPCSPPRGLFSGPVAALGVLYDQYTGGTLTAVARLLCVLGL